MVNWVISKIGQSNKVPQDGSLSAETIKLLDSSSVLGADIESKSKMMQILAANFNQQEICNPSLANKLMQSYIVENELFDDMVQIPVPARNPDKLREQREITARLQSDYMAAVLGQFVKMVINDSDFYQTVIEGFNQTRAVNKEKGEMMEQSIFDLADNLEELIKLIISWINNNETDYTKLMCLLSKIDDEKEEISKRHDLTLSPRVRLPIINSSKLLLLRKDCDYYNDRRHMVGAHIALHNNLSQVIRQIKCEETPILQINQISRHLNEISKALGLCIAPLPILEENYSTSAIINITTEAKPCLPLILKSGKKVTLPLHNPDLSSLNKGILCEILEVLDTTSADDHRFNNLRRLITDRLALMSKD